LNPIIALHNRLFSGLERNTDLILPTLARLVFAGVLCGYFWASASTKLGDNLFSLSDGAFAQIFPKAFEAAGYDSSQMTVLQGTIALAGTYAEFVLPFLIAVGLLTRLSALGMIGFIVVQSLTDIYGHGASVETVGTWFDRAAGGLIADQRAFWILALLVLVFKGAGPLSADCALRQWVSG
jgi:putative oxidoreductase